MALAAARHNHFYPPFPFPPPDPYFNPYYQNHPYYNRDVGPFFQPRRVDPRYSAALDVDAEVVDEADELLEELREEEEWMADRERSRRKKGGQQQHMRGGEVINNFDDPEPMRSAAAYPSDLYEDENKFQGRKPGQAVNAESGRAKRPEGGSSGGGGGGGDPREQHVILDDYEDYANAFFHQRPLPPPHRPPPRRGGGGGGPSTYTPEEEELIAAMGGRGPHAARSTQEFAGLGTMTKDRGMHPDEAHRDPQQQNYNPEQNYDPPPPPMAQMPNDIMPPMEGPGTQMFGRQRQEFREEGFLGDSTLKEIAMDYAVPIPYLADVLASWGAPVPIDPAARLGDMVTGEQAFAVLEAIHTLDVASLHERYSEDTLMNICDYYDVDLKEAFEFCVEGRGWALPFGVRTFLRVEQEAELLDALGGEGVY